MLQGRKSHIKIHEDAAGGIYMVGVTTQSVGSLSDVSICDMGDETMELK